MRRLRRGERGAHLPTRSASPPAHPLRRPSASRAPRQVSIAGWYYCFECGRPHGAPKPPPPGECGGCGEYVSAPAAAGRAPIAEDAPRRPRSPGFPRGCASDSPALPLCHRYRRETCGSFAGTAARRPGSGIVAPRGAPRGSRLTRSWGTGLATAAARRRPHSPPLAACRGDRSPLRAAHPTSHPASRPRRQVAGTRYCPCCGAQKPG